jgi:hypothetical protein
MKGLIKEGNNAAAEARTATFTRAQGWVGLMIPNTAFTGYGPMALYTGPRLILS